MQLTRIKTLFNSWFSPLEVIVSCFLSILIEMFKVSLFVVEILLSCSINVDFAGRLNECPGFLKCKLEVIDFGLLTSFLWLFTFM